MYQFIIRAKIRRSFADLSAGSADYALTLMAQNCSYRFLGDHALGGSRSNRDLIKAWFERFLRILPGFKYTPREVVIKGWPWSLKVFVRLEVSWQSPWGEVYQNEALQMIDLKFFKATRVLTIDDSLGFSRLLTKVAEKSGVAEAVAPQIEG